MYRRYNEIAANATSVFISHRLASTRFCDRIFLLEGANFVESGTHDELMKRGGKYRELFDIQSKYYRENSHGEGVQNHLQYEHLENPEVVLLRSKIFAALNATGGGLCVVKWSTEGMLRHILNIIFSISLTVSMFAMSATGEFTGIFAFINSPVSAVVIIALIAVNTVLSIKISSNAVSDFASEFGRLHHNNVYLKQLYEYLDLPNNMYKGTLAVEKRDDIDYEIEFRDVSFKYPHTDTWALRHVSIKFKIGDKLAIVGENGSGKTTFIKLLCRLYDSTEGKILLNGIDITRYRYDEYMMLFSVVFQDYTLFGFPLGENVAADCTLRCLIMVNWYRKVRMIRW